MSCYVPGALPLCPTCDGPDESVDEERDLPPTQTEAHDKYGIEPEPLYNGPGEPFA